jgi:phosphatidate cytidylyltransferase
VTGVDPANKKRLSTLLDPAGRSNLVLRVASSIVLAPLAIAAAYYGDLIFLAFWTLAAIGVLWEWDSLVCAHEKNPVLAIGAVTLAGSSLLLALDRGATAIALLALGAFGVATLASRTRRSWCVAGMLYAGAMMLAPVLLRRDPNWGFAAIIFLFVVVWATDIIAYFVGRALGGPKLMPRVSPGKTWSGAIGGTLAGVFAGVVTAHYLGVRNLLAVAVVALILSVVAQAGDLLESAIKRRFAAKDTSSILPGHGGLMDRLDGFLTAAVAALLIGLFHGGSDAPAGGLIVW